MTSNTLKCKTSVQSAGYSEKPSKPYKSSKSIKEIRGSMRVIEVRMEDIITFFQRNIPGERRH
jgi:hypothetical protein